MIVVSGNGPTLLGRNWIRELDLNICNETVSLIDNQQTSNSKQQLEHLLEQYSEILTPSLTPVKDVKAKLHVDPNTAPKFYKARPVPYALKDKIDQELDRLQELGIIQPTQYNDWAAPIVPIIKTDGSIRICGDYKVTVNTCSTLDTYPLPKIEDLFSKLTGGKTFTKLDIPSN